MFGPVGDTDHDVGLMQERRNSITNAYGVTINGKINISNAYNKAMSQDEFVLT